LYLLYLLKKRSGPYSQDGYTFYPVKVNYNILRNYSYRFISRTKPSPDNMP